MQIGRLHLNGRQDPPYIFNGHRLFSAVWAMNADDGLLAVQQVGLIVYRQNFTVIDGSGHGIVSPFADTHASMWVYDRDVSFGAVPFTTPTLLTYDADNYAYPIPRPERGFSVYGQGNTIVAGFEHYAIAAHGDGNTIIGHDGLNDIATSGNDVTVAAGGGDDFTLIGSFGSYYSMSYAAAPSDNVKWLGEDGNDTLLGTMTNSTINGGAGNDSLSVAGSNNAIFAGDGNDTVLLRGLKQSTVDTGAGNDYVKVFYSSGIAVLTGEGDDRINIAGPDCSIDAGSGNDIISASGGIVLAGEGNDTVTLNGGGSATGGAGDDQIKGSNFADMISGGDGADIINGRMGDDLINAGKGNDTIDGGKGIDTLSFAGSWQAVVVDMSKHIATGQGTDTFKGIEDIMGSSGRDVITGDKNANTLSGGLSADSLRGGGGADTLSGGSGSDVFVFKRKDAGTGVDHITDFSAADKIDLHDILKGKDSSAFETLVHVEDGVSGSTISVSIAGQFVDLAVLENVHRVSAASLLSDGLIIA